MRKRTVFTALLLLPLLGIVLWRAESAFDLAMRGLLALRGIASRHVESGGDRIFLYEGGREHPETIVLLHGVGGEAASSWFQLMPVLARKFHVIAPDLFFANLPDLVTSGYRIESEARLVREVLDGLGVDDATLVGLSYGAWPALRFAELAPERVRGLVLISPLAGGSGRVLDALHLDPKNPGRSFYRRLFVSPPPIPDVFMHRLWDRTTRVLGALPDLRPELDRAGRLLDAGLPRMNRPVLILYGKEDAIIPREYVEGLAARLPHARLHGLDRCGHAVVWDRMDAVPGLLESFLASEGGAR